LQPRRQTQLAKKVASKINDVARGRDHQATVLAEARVGHGVSNVPLSSADEPSAASSPRPLDQVRLLQQEPGRAPADRHRCGHR